MKKLISFLFAASLLSACQTTEPIEIMPAGWEPLDAGVFTVSAPTGWEYEPMQGMDSTIGIIRGDDIELEFDYGMYSGFVDNGTEDLYNIEDTTIDGYEAQIATPKSGEEGLTIVYFESASDGNRFNLYGRDLTGAEQTTVLQIFQSIEFKQ